MATKQELIAKFQSKLMELFQLDQPDLDFGFYRVMHAKKNEIEDFVNNKLPKIITDAFNAQNLTQLQQEFEAAKKAVEEGLGKDALLTDGTVAPTLKTLPLATNYMSAKEALEKAKSNGDPEADIYNHLYHFFERYYDKGDFISLRYLTRETDRKAQPYAIPYAGEEVKLHWANADQYYIKTSEKFTNYSFDAVLHPDVVKMDEMKRIANAVPDKLKVRFSVVGADEGEHGNIKKAKNKFFILYADKPYEINDEGDIYIYFEYREDSEMTGQAATWQEKRRKEALDTLKEQSELPRFLFYNLNEEGQGEEKILLDVYLRRYFARNTADYFIHKDLGGFLRRELDFYIKNEMIQLDNIAFATPEVVASWLEKVKVFRDIAHSIILFLAQLEDFQKKLWLKKKFVVQCDYCITLDRIPQPLREEVLANEFQKQEWKRLGFEENQSSTTQEGGESSSCKQGELALSVASSTVNIDARMVDTKFFNEDFKEKLIASIPDLDSLCGGLLIHSDNFGALRFLQERFHSQIKCIYIDPPYNTENDGFLYKDGYKDSSWLSLIDGCTTNSFPLTTKDNVLFTSLDYNENFNYRTQLSTLHKEYLFVGEIHWESKTKSQNTKTSFNKLQPKIEIIFVHSRQEGRRFNVIVIGEKEYPLSDEKGKYRELELEVMNSTGIRGRDSMIFPITANGVTILPPQGKQWKIGKDQYDTYKKADDIIIRENKVVIKMRPEYERTEITEPFWGFFDKSIGTTESAKSDLTDILPGHGFDTVKPMLMIKRLVYHATDNQDIVLDYFAGSGTTAHAVIDLNRSMANEQRKYILVEMGNHFNTVLKPRIEKIVYSPNWKNGKPENTDKGISHCFKYIRLESYEDTLNNLIVDGEKGGAYKGVGDYFLKYMLDVETKGSQSLLNIQAFADPFNYKLSVKKPASEEREDRTVDLVETFNYLIGLRVKQINVTRRYNAEFERKPDPELPEDAHTKLSVKKFGLDSEGQWKFRLVEGWIPRNRFTPNDGAKDRVLIIWRNLTDDLEKDNAVLDAFLQHKEINALDGEYDIIYINGSNNIQNMAKDGDTWKVRLIEEDFMARMWEGV